MYKECFPECGWKIVEKLRSTITANDLILAGGTALSLQLGHRVSEDLDFFSISLKPEKIITALKDSGLKFQILSESRDDILALVENLKFSVFVYPYPFLEPYTLLDSLALAGVKDIAAMKIIALSQRGTRRDFVDLYFILKQYPFEVIAKHLVRRYGEERINPVHIGKSLVYFLDADNEPDPVYTKGNETPWPEIRQFFTSRIKQYVYTLEAL